jgi:hypothetical protein
MEWLLGQPDTILSQSLVNEEFLQAQYTMLHPKIITDTVHEDVIRKELTKGLADYIEDMQEEIDFAFKKIWGTDNSEWVEICAYDAMLEIIARISNRVLVGIPLCEYIPSLGQ